MIQSVTKKSKNVNLFNVVRSGPTYFIPEELNSLERQSARFVIQSLIKVTNLATAWPLLNYVRAIR